MSEHGWPDPSALAGGLAAFTPADPGEALFEASSGVRAYIVPADRDPLVRIPAALPLGRLHEAEGEAGASALLTQLLTTRGAAGLSRPPREMRGMANWDDFEVPETASGTGLLLVRTGRRPAAVGTLVRYSLEALARIHDPDEPVSDAEVTRVQGWLFGAVWQLSLEFATDASPTLALEPLRRDDSDHLVEWPEAFLSVTAGDVQRVAQEYLDPSTLVTVVPGPRDEIRAPRHPRWMTCKQS